MKIPDTYPRIAVSQDGDVLISRGPAQPVLFVSRNALPAFLDSPQDAGVAEIRGVGAAAIMACLAGGTQFETIAAAPLTLHFTLRNGLKVLFSDDDSVFDKAGREMAHRSDVLVSRQQVVLTGPRAASRLNLVLMPAAPANSDFEDKSSYAKVVTIKVRQALQKRVAAPANGPRP
jgi:hypothetical protein